jgi:hypothetical protein
MKRKKKGRTLEFPGRKLRIYGPKIFVKDLQSRAPGYPPPPEIFPDISVEGAEIPGGGAEISAPTYTGISGPNVQQRLQLVGGV